MNRARTAAAEITYSPSWTLIPTHWCRNTCGYCAFVARSGAAAELISPAAARAEIERARAAGATELLIMSGEGIAESAPMRAALRRYGFDTYIDYLIDIARAALDHFVLPHVNIGNVSEAEIRALRAVVPSMGMMVETSDNALRRAAAHGRAPDKDPARRFETLCAAGRAQMPFTTGLLIGIGESRGGRAETLHMIAAVQRTYGHLQEVIVQPFTPHAGTAMESFSPPSLAEMIDAVALARAILPAEVIVQVPPNIAPRFVELVRAGARDLGGISPDGDRINPAERWHAPGVYAAALQPEGFTLRPRLAVYDRLISPRWLSAASLRAVRRLRGEAASPGRTAAEPETADVTAAPTTGDQKKRGLTAYG